MSALYLTLSFVLSFLVCLLIVRYEHTHAHLTADHDLSGPQKIHLHPVPRVGGLAIIIAFIAGVLPGYWFENRVDINAVMWLIVAALPLFIGGLLEDILKIGLVKTRLAAMIVSAILLIVCNGWVVSRLDVPYEHLVLIPIVMYLLTIFALAGVVNSFNFIDGYNGLSAAVSIIMLISLAYVALKINDRVVLLAAVTMIGAIFGFLLWNWPRGLIFLGDGGAYFIGFMIASLAIAIVFRNPSVSPWYALVLMLYPIVETVFTINRRLHRQDNPSLPDAAHLHQLIYKRMMRWAVGSRLPRDKMMRNSMTSPYLWFLSSLAVIPATLFWAQTIWLQLTALIFVIGYVWLYRSIAQFRSPKWLIYKSKVKKIKK
ncbi:glycosyltransferase family 4 protein [uncultured Deefgea sp.]|uniref:glycosyltransferase family 4 protein n=1 Tax=uncultured Deefgea sp. TaxID=1304914 RepID=UPI0025934927|nr:MraY family glycosyltransferase [uncultured Deefgea sp.]